MKTRPMCTADKVLTTKSQIHVCFVNRAPADPALLQAQTP